MSSDRKRWREFRQSTQTLAEGTGLPISILEDKRLFDYFLMHGYVDYPLDPTGTTIARLDDQQRRALKELVVQYLQHGFVDPGLCLFAAIRISRAVNQALSRKRGKVFSDRFHEHVLKSLRETKAAVSYVIHNYRKHCAETGHRLAPSFIDPHSSAIYRAGNEPNPLPTPRFWLLDPVWKRQKESRRGPGERSDSIAGTGQGVGPFSESKEVIGG
jgi:hypothetical protein